MSRWIDAEHAEFRLQCCGTYHGVIAFDTVKAVLNDAPSIDIVFCKECKHRPIKEDANEDGYGFNVIAPNEDERCPCLVEDGWYSWIPKDNFTADTEKERASDDNSTGHNYRL